MNATLFRIVDHGHERLTSTKEHCDGQTVEEHEGGGRVEQAQVDAHVVIGVCFGDAGEGVQLAERRQQVDVDDAVAMKQVNDCQLRWWLTRYKLVDH